MQCTSNDNAIKSSTLCLFGIILPLHYLVQFDKIANEKELKIYHFFFVFLTPLLHLTLF